MALFLYKGNNIHTVKKNWADTERHKEESENHFNYPEVICCYHFDIHFFAYKISVF